MWVFLRVSCTILSDVSMTLCAFCHMDKIVDVQNHQGHGAAHRAGFSSAGQEERNGCSSRNWHLALGS